MQPVVKPRSRLWAPTLVLALAALLRLVHLATVPFGWHPDEATKALLALDINTPEGKEILTLNRATKYIPTKAENYKGLERAGKSAGLIK
jgi:hypothetical protein